MYKKLLLLFLFCVAVSPQAFAQHKPPVCAGVRAVGSINDLRFDYLGDRTKEKTCEALRIASYKAARARLTAECKRSKYGALLMMTPFPYQDPPRTMNLQDCFYGDSFWG